MKQIATILLFICATVVSGFGAVGNPNAINPKAPPQIKKNQAELVYGIPKEVLNKLPFFTGPLITPSGHIIQGGTYDVEPYVYFTRNYGEYNKNNQLVIQNTSFDFNLQMYTQIGLTSFMDIVLIPQVFSKYNNGHHSTVFGDLPVTLEFQLLMDTPKNYLPGVKFEITETFPTGNYEELDPEKDSTDSGGQGTYTTSFGLYLTRTWNVYTYHFLSLRGGGSYGMSSPVHVKGFNTYGGGFNTLGKVKPGNSWFFATAAEYNLTVNWALALDLTYSYSNSTKFSGIKGTTQSGEEASLESPSSSQWTLAPAIEYNIDEHLGFIAGIWASFYGRNSAAFVSGVAAFNVYY